jgi:hypothetical protein
MFFTVWRLALGLFSSTRAKLSDDPPIEKKIEHGGQRPMFRDGKIFVKGCQIS